MSYDTALTAQQFATDARRRSREFALWGVLLGLAAGACLIVLQSAVPPFAIIACVAVVVAIWHSPRLGVFLMFGATLFIEADLSHFPTRIVPIQQAPFFVAYSPPFFRPIQEIVRGSGIILSTAELCMGFIALSCALRAAYARQFRFQRGVFSASFLILVGWWTFATINGIATGASAKLAFLELRVPAYTVILYFLTYNLLTRRSDLDTLGWLILVGAGIRGLESIYLGYVTFHGDLGWTTSGASILEHHESFLFNGYLFYTILLFVTGGSNRQKGLASALLPIIFVANVLNSRRSSTAATMLGLILLAPMLYAALKERRVALLRLGAAVTLFAALYVGMFWNHNGMIAQPIRALRSQFTPNARDESSDAYRKLENQNISYTISTSPILGYGFGKEFLRPYPMLDLRSVDPYLFLLPHNSILWVWMRLGTLGFLFFWFLNAQWITRGCRIACRYTDGCIRRWALFAVVIVGVNLAIAYLDMGLQGQRIQIYMGVVLGILDRLPLMLDRSIVSE